MDGFKDTTSREDIKEVLGEDIDCDEAIAFVDFERGKTSGYIRFKEENAAKDLAEKLSEKHKDDKLKVKEAEIEFKLLEGDEENEYLEKAAADIKQRKNNFLVSLRCQRLPCTISSSRSIVVLTSNPHNILDLVVLGG